MRLDKKGAVATNGIHQLSGVEFRDQTQKQANQIMMEVGSKQLVQQRIRG